MQGVLTGSWLVYMGLLAQYLVKRDELVDDKQLPPILPLLYNGLPPWRAPIDVAELFTAAPPGLDAYQPRLTYHLIDEARLKLESWSETIRAGRVNTRIHSTWTPTGSLPPLVGNPFCKQFKTVIPQASSRYWMFPDQVS